MFHTWALGNIVLSFLNVLFAFAASVILALFLMEGYKRKSLIGPFIAFITGIIGVTVFLIWSDMRLPLTLINHKTVLHIAILATQVILIILAIARMPVYKKHIKKSHRNLFQKQSHQRYYPYQQPYNQHYVPLFHIGNNRSVPTPNTDIDAKKIP